MLLLTERRCNDALVLLGLLLLLWMHSTLSLLRRSLRLLLLIHHMLLLRLQMLMLRLLLRVLRLLRLHMRMLGVHLMVHLRLDEGRTIRSVENGALMIDSSRLKFATGIDDGGGRMSVGGRCVSHVTHTGVRRRRPVAGHAVHTSVFLLMLLIVGRVPHVDPIVRGKPRIRILLTSSRGSIMMGGYSLT